MVALPKVPYYTPEEYLTIERKARYKSEYLDGEIVAMPGASREHNLISVELVRGLGNQLENSPCELYSADMRVRIPTISNYYYPDLSIVYAEPQFTDEYVDTLVNPLIIIEILSPSTEGFDRGRKFREYQTIASLMEYILISQDEPVVDHYCSADWRRVAAVHVERVRPDATTRDGELRIPFKPDLPADPV